MQDASLDVEGELAEQLCYAFEQVCLKFALKLKALDLAAKTFHGRVTLLVRVCFVEGNSVYHR